jgi:hypothetical protein
LCWDLALFAKSLRPVFAFPLSAWSWFSSGSSDPREGMVPSPRLTKSGWYKRGPAWWLFLCPRHQEEFMEAWFICKQTVSSPAKMFPGSLLGNKCGVGGKTAFWGGGAEAGTRKCLRGQLWALEAAQRVKRVEGEILGFASLRALSLQA